MLASARASSHRAVVLGRDGALARRPIGAALRAVDQVWARWTHATSSGERMGDGEVIVTPIVQ